MKQASEIISLLKNNAYYIDKIEKCTEEQIREDCKLSQVNLNVCSTRFRALVNILSACSTIRTYMLGINANLQTAVDQDKLLTQYDVEVQDQYPEEGNAISDNLGTTKEDYDRTIKQREQSNEQSEQQQQQQNEQRKSESQGKFIEPGITETGHRGSEDRYSKY